MKKRNIVLLIVIIFILILIFQMPNYSTKTKLQKVETRVGTLKYEGSYPTNKTIEMMRDEMLFQSATQVYLWSRPLANIIALRDSNLAVGVTNTSVQITEDYMTSAQVIPTANQATIYAYGIIKLEDEPIVFESVEKTLGVLDDAWQRPITDIGYLGPDEGKGGKYIIVPPDYKGKLPRESRDTFVFKSPTKNVMWLMRGFATNGDKKPAIEALKGTRIYKLSEMKNPPKQKYINMSEIPFDSMPPEGCEYWKFIAKALNEETVAERDRAMMALVKNLGIEKGKPFNPDARTKAILTEAAKVGEGMIKTLAFANRKEWAKKYKDSQWEFVLLSKSALFEAERHTEVYERAAYTYQAITVASPMILPLRGKASKYLGTFKDSDGNWLDGGKTYKLKVPANPPVKRFWSLAVYDTETRSLIQNGTPKSTVGSNRPEIKMNKDGTFDVYIGPKAPKGMESNWVKTIPGRNVFVYFRFYSPTEPFFDGSWKLGDLELVK